MNFLQSVGDFFNPERIVGFFSTAQALWYILGFIFFVYVIVSCVLVYHWRRYGLKSRLIVFAEIVYFVGSVVLFLLAGLCVTLI